MPILHTLDSEPLCHSATFGIEFEFDLVYPSGELSGNRHRSGYGPCIHGWSYQTDCTTAYELFNSNPWKSLAEAAESIQRQFTQWIERNEGAVPLSINSDLIPLDNDGHRHSKGQHLHVGKGTNESLDTAELLSIRNHTRMIYPFVAGMQVQPYPSTRGLTSQYAQSINTYNGNYTRDHYCELSHSSEHGTMEFRVFDANIPQISLATAYLMTHMSEHAREKCHCLPEDLIYSASHYESQRREAMNHGIANMPIVNYLNKLKKFTSHANSDLELECIREILYLIAKHKLTPYSAYERLNALSPIGWHKYFKAMYENPAEYFANLLKITTGTAYAQVVNWISEAQHLQAMDDVINLAIASQGVQIEAPRIIATANFTLSRSMAQAAINGGQFSISRIADAGIPTDVLLQKVSYLLGNNGDSYTNPMEPNMIQDAHERFYVLTIPTRAGRELIACGAIRMRNGRISHIATHRMYRRLGAGKRIVKCLCEAGLHAEGHPRIHTVIKNGNAVSETLFKSLGFVSMGIYNDDSSTWVLRPAQPTPQPHIASAARQAPSPRAQRTLEDIMDVMREESDRWDREQSRSPEDEAELRGDT